MAPGAAISISANPALLDLDLDRRPERHVGPQAADRLDRDPDQRIVSGGCLDVLLGVRRHDRYASAAADRAGEPQEGKRLLPLERSPPDAV